MQSSFPFVPESASSISSDVDAVYFYISGVTVFFTLLISAVVIFFVIRFRRRNAFEIPRPIEGSTTLETLWSAIPLPLGLGIFVWGGEVYFGAARPPVPPLGRSCTGRQAMAKPRH